MDTVQENRTEMGANIDLCNVDAYEDPVTHQVVKAKPCNGDHHPERCQGGREKWPKGTTTKIQVYFLSLLALFMVALPAEAFPGDKMLPSIKNGVSRASKRTWKIVRHVVMEPTESFHYVAFPIEHPLQFGQMCETNGTNGLMSFIGSGANIGTTTLVGAKNLGGSKKVVIANP